MLKRTNLTKFSSKGQTSSGVLYIILLAGIIGIGYMFVGPVLPTKQTNPKERTAVTIFPQNPPSQSSLQLQRFEGVSGIPTPTPRR